MIFGLTFEKVIVLAFIAVIFIGPEKLPALASSLAGLVRTGRAALHSAKERAEAELGPEMSDVDWKKLDPRQYDPRRIIREALVDEITSAPRGLDGNPQARTEGAD